MRWLDEVQLTRRRPWPGVVGVQAQVGEDGCDGVCLHHHGEQLAARAAVRTPQDVDGEGPLEQLGPGAVEDAVSGTCNDPGSGLLGSGLPHATCRAVKRHAVL